MKDNQNKKNRSENYHGTSKPLSASLSETLSIICDQMGNSSDFIIRKMGSTSDLTPLIAVSFIEGLVDAQLLTNLIEVLSCGIRDEQLSIAQNMGAWLSDQVPAGSLQSIDTVEQLILSILEGQAVIMSNGSSRALSVAITGGPKRSVEEPTSQTVVRGPKEGFTEDIATNIALLRRKIKSPDLCIESRHIGKYTQTKVSIAYIRSIANLDVVTEISKRLDSINTDSILESSYIEEFIQDDVRTPFPTIYNTERPDAIASGLLEGLVAIFVDGTPFVLLAPITFFRFFISSEDYYIRYDLASFLRIIRFTSFFVALLLPAVYIATTTFHQEMLPTTLLITLAAQRENTPLPALLEALIMEATFEVIREAGVRMPRAIGPAISIVGALVLGQAAVQAGLVSAAMVIVVSFTAISNFVMPNINMSGAIRLLRFILMLLAGLFGLFGILACSVSILVRLVSIQSLGVPYFIPLSPFKKTNWKDTVVRSPWWKMKLRPLVYGQNKNTRRQSVKQESFAQQEADRKFDPLA